VAEWGGESGVEVEEAEGGDVAVGEGGPGFSALKRGRGLVLGWDWGVVEGWVRNGGKYHVVDVCVYIFGAMPLYCLRMRRAGSI